MPATTLSVNKIAEAVVGKTTFTVPTVYIGLSTTTPVVAGTGTTEPSGNAYARLAGVIWATAAGGVTSNSAVATFPQATGAWGTLTTVVAFDASTAGNLLWFQALGTAKTVGSTDIVSFPVGAITYTQV